jgi:hypothetical protein
MHKTLAPDHFVRPVHTYRQSKGQFTVRLPALVWNAYTPSAPASPKPTRCTYRPGTGSFRYGPKTITYRQPCLRNTCPNCRKWYPKLADELESPSLCSLQEKHESRPVEQRGNTVPAAPARLNIHGPDDTPGTPANCTIRLRFRSCGSRLYYERLLLERRLRYEVGH